MLDRRVVTFMQVAESGSFSKAAAALFLSTVSVKKQIDSLELTVGARLFERTSRGARLTPAGEAYFEGAKKIEFLAERTVAKTRAANAASQHTVRIGTSFLRPCRPLIDLWTQVDAHEDTVHLEIVPFDDDTASMNEMVESLGKRIDCFIAPCDSEHWRATCNLLVIDELPFRLAVSRRHPLADKELLTWDDLDGETLMMVPGDDSPVVGAIRRTVRENHPCITLAAAPTHYDAAVFNRCEQTGCLLQTYEVWKDAHTMLATIPVDWPERMPYGIVYSKRPNEATRVFVDAIAQHLN